MDAHVAYAGSPAAYGTPNDPLVNKRIGGINAFGGGLPVYKGGKKIGAIGASGDTSCTDHAFAWRLRMALVNAGLATDTSGDEVTIGTGAHPACMGASKDPQGTKAQIGIIYN